MPIRGGLYVVEVPIDASDRWKLHSIERTPAAAREAAAAVENSRVTCLVLNKAGVPAEGQTPGPLENPPNNVYTLSDKTRVIGVFAKYDYARDARRELKDTAMKIGCRTVQYAPTGAS